MRHEAETTLQADRLARAKEAEVARLVRARQDSVEDDLRKQVATLTHKLETTLQGDSMMQLLFFNTFYLYELHLHFSRIISPNFEGVHELKSVKIEATSTSRVIDSFLSLRFSSYSRQNII